ncbi:MAG: PilZ domain-containing protein [Elusimicrobia bacterium]|nr:PilZ domain-containing protein [Elusimicrobiota bacterium]
MANKKEQRKYERHPASFVLEIADFAKPSKKVSALVTDVSEGGLCFESDQKIELGSSLTLRLEVPLMVQGGVVRTETRGNKFRYGVRFHNVRFSTGRPKFARPRTMIRMPNLNTLPGGKP